jgi:hypothetical protein
LRYNLNVLSRLPWILYTSEGVLMKFGHKHFVLIIVILMTPCLSGQSVAPINTGNGSSDRVFIGGFVLRVNAEAITSNEIIEMLNERLAQQLDTLVNTKNQREAQEGIVQMVLQYTTSRIQELLLYQHAYNDLNKGDKLDEQLDKEANRYRSDYLRNLDNNKAIALQKVKEQKIDLDDIVEEYKKGMLIDSYRQATRGEAGITTRLDLMRYYRKHLGDQYTEQDSIQFQLCDIPIGDDPGHAIKIAKAARSALKNGASFDKIVQQYSHGFRKSYDGIWRPLDPVALQPLYQPIVKALHERENGYISDVIESESHLFIAKLLSRTHASVKKFSNVQHEIRQNFDKKAWEAYRAKTSKVLYEEASISERALEVFAQRTTIEIYRRYK